MTFNGEMGGSGIEILYMEARQINEQFVAIINLSQ